MKIWNRILGDTCLRSLVFLISMVTLSGPSLAEEPTDTVGNDDVIIAIHDTIDGDRAYHMDIAENGDIYVAVCIYEPESERYIRVYRSQDGGTTWHSFGLLKSDDPDVWHAHPRIHVAQGDVSRVYVAYDFHQPDVASSARVSFKDTTDPPNGAFTHRVPIQTPGVNYSRPDITSDATSFGTFRLYMVAQEDNLMPESNHIWFARSTDFGETWEVDYEISAVAFEGAGYFHPRVAYGLGGYVHVAWQLATPFTEAWDDAIRYLRAADFAENGLADWDAMERITSKVNDFNEFDPDLAVNPLNGDVALNFGRMPVGGGPLENLFRLSTDTGATWDTLVVGYPPAVKFPQVVALPGGDGYRASGDRYWLSSYGFSLATSANPLTWSTEEILADRAYSVDPYRKAAMIDYDPTRGNQLGMLWAVIAPAPPSTSPDTLFFDAEWRDDPGYPGFADGFPVELDAGAESHPLLVDLGTSAPAFVSIGTISDETPRELVVCSGTEIHLLRKDATPVPDPDFPITVPDPILAPAALGDLNANGNTEIVVGAGDYVYAFDNDGLMLFSAWVRDADIVRSLTLGDLDLDATLEIAVPTNSGEVHVLEDDGSDRPGWPYYTTISEYVTSVAIANYDHDPELELAVASRDYTVFALEDDGTLATGWPAQTNDPYWIYSMPIVDPTAGTSPDILTGTRDESVYAFRFTGDVKEGWPKDVLDDCGTTPASGDIDGDGDVEVAVVTESQLIILEVNTPVETDETLCWPMFAHDPRRTGCADCDETLPAAVGEDQSITRGVRFAAPAPNITAGGTQLRYHLPAHAAVSLVVFDIEGRQVRRLLKEEQPAGDHAIYWDGRDTAAEKVSGGTYFVRLQVRSAAGSVSTIRRVVVSP